MKFKVGDKVICIKSSDAYLTKGKVYTIVQSRREFVRVVEDHGNLGVQRSISRFKSAPQYNTKLAELL